MGKHDGIRHCQERRAVENYVIKLEFPVLQEIRMRSESRSSAGKGGIGPARNTSMPEDARYCGAVRVIFRISSTER